MLEQLLAVLQNGEADERIAALKQIGEARYADAALRPQNKSCCRKKPARITWRQGNSHTA